MEDCFYRNRGKNDNEKFVPSESDKEAIRKNIEEIECLKIQSPLV